MASSSNQHPDIFAIRDFKHEPDDFVPESPRILPLALGGPGDKSETTSAKGKEFRCPFRTEDNRVCNDSNDSLNEVLCHFYARHFARSLDNEKDSKVFQPMRCFYSSCSKTFRLHHLLVGHMHKHEGGKQNLWFINYLYENLKNNHDLKVSDLKALHKEDIKDFQEDIKDLKVKEEEQAATIRKLREENGIYKKFQEQLDDQKKRYDELMMSNKQLLKENQDLKQSGGYGPCSQQARVVTLDKYNELLERLKVEKERVDALEGMCEAEKGKTAAEKRSAEAEKRRADTEKKRADRLEKSDEYWEEGPCKRKREYKEEQ